MRGLIGKVAIVTGGARGLGAACAARLAEEGATVVIADLLADEGAAKAAELRDSTRQEILALPHDVRDEVSWGSLINEASGRLGGVDILVNNAGIAPNGDIESITLQDLREVLDVNLVGAFLGSKAVIPEMRKRGGGSIINMSSALSRKVLPFTCAYGMSKSALVNLTKTTAVHCARMDYNIRVNSVHPGPHETPLFKASAATVADDPHTAKINASIPMARFGRPPEVGAVVAFLASDDASYVTATEIFVDGGLSAV